MKGDYTRFTFRPEHHYSSVLVQQGRATLDADFNEQAAIMRHRVETETRDVVGAAGAPKHAPGFAITASGQTVTIGAGRYYVDGLLVTNETDVALGAQPQLPAITGVPADAPAPGTYVAYLDVWERHLTAIERAELREVALGGPDTAARSQLVWQVRLLPVTAGATCAATLPEWTTLTAPSAARLAASAAAPATPTNPCLVPPSAGYRRLENQLYRVEIHEPGALGDATYVWSRDNGAVVARWIAQSGNDLTISATNRDEVLGFASDQWLELIDDARELSGTPGTLVQIDRVEDRVITVRPATATGPLDLIQFGVGARVRRWDGHGLVRQEDPNVSPDGSLELEDGVRVRFSAGPFATGDWWAIPARTATGAIEWPQNGAGPAALPPAGIRHHRAKLAVLQRAGGWTVIENCRPVFPPLTELPEPGGAGPVEPEPGFHVVAVEIAGQPVRNDTALDALHLARGLIVVCDQPVDPSTVDGKPVLGVTLDLPWPVGDSERKAWRSSAPVATMPITLAGNLEAREQMIVWRPAPRTVKWLVGELGTVLHRLKIERVLAHLRVQGRFIRSTEGDPVYLDGEAFGVPDGAVLDVELPSGDRRRGGDLRMWFWLAARPGEEPEPQTKFAVLAGFAGSVRFPEPDRRLELLRAIDVGVLRDDVRDALPPGYVAREDAEFNIDESRARAHEATDGGERTVVLLVEPELLDLAKRIADALAHHDVPIRFEIVELQGGEQGLIEAVERREFDVLLTDSEQAARLDEGAFPPEERVVV